jgi:LCP family protein required for cell wall assembly
MFEHLDDPAGFTPDAGLREAAMARGRRLRFVRRLAAVGAAVTLVLATVGVAGGLYVARRDAAIDRVDVATEPSLDGATNVLLVGSDGRPGVEGVRADAIAVLRIEPDGAMRLLSIPRDLVDPRTGRRLAFGTAAGDAGGGGGGLHGLVDVVHHLTGIPVDHYVELGLAGFVDVVDAIGGLRLAVDVPLRDRSTGLDLHPSACATLDGETALALVRARSIDGDTSGDLGRMARTQLVVAAAAAQLMTHDEPAPSVADRLSRILADHAVVDDGLDLQRMVELTRTVVAGPGLVQSGTVPLVFNPADIATVRLAPDAGEWLQQFGAPASHDPVGAGGAGGGGATVPADVPTGIRPC